MQHTHKEVYQKYQQKPNIPTVVLSSRAATVLWCCWLGDNQLQHSTAETLTHHSICNMFI